LLQSARLGLTEQDRFDCCPSRCHRIGSRPSLASSAYECRWLPSAQLLKIISEPSRRLFVRVEQPVYWDSGCHRIWKDQNCRSRTEQELCTSYNMCILFDMAPMY